MFFFGCHHSGEATRSRVNDKSSTPKVLSVSALARVYVRSKEWCILLLGKDPFSVLVSTESRNTSFCFKEVSSRSTNQML